MTPRCPFIYLRPTLAKKSFGGTAVVVREIVPMLNFELEAVIKFPCYILTGRKGKFEEVK